MRPGDSLVRGSRGRRTRRSLRPAELSPRDHARPVALSRHRGRLRSPPHDPRRSDRRVWAPHTRAPARRRCRLTALYVPVTFTLAEVTFRGAFDAPCTIPVNRTSISARFWFPRYGDCGISRWRWGKGLCQCSSWGCSECSVPSAYRSPCAGGAVEICYECDPRACGCGAQRYRGSPTSVSCRHAGAVHYHL